MRASWRRRRCIAALPAPLTVDLAAVRLRLGLRPDATPEEVKVEIFRRLTWVADAADALLPEDSPHSIPDALVALTEGRLAGGAAFLGAGLVSVEEELMGRCASQAGTGGAGPGAGE